MSNTSPPKTTFDTVYLYDAKSRLFTTPPITKKSEDFYDPVMRIMRDGSITVEESGLVPDPRTVADLVGRAGKR